MRDRISQDKNIIIGLTLLALVLRLAFFLFFDNSFSHEGESYSKINLVRVWIQHDKSYPDINFGPLHTWLIYVLYSIFGAWIWPVRVFHLILGIATVPIFYLLTREEFGARIARIAGVFFAAFPVHLRGSPTGLTEVPYLFFFVIGLYAFFRVLNRRRDGWGWLALSAAAITAAGMLRFEAWLFLPVLCLLMVRRKFWSAAVFGALCMVFPLVHMFMAWRITGQPTSFAKTSSLSFLQYMPNLPMYEKATGWFISFWIGMGPPAVVLAVLGMLLAAVRRTTWSFAVLLLFPLAILQYKAMTNTIDPSLERYIVSLATLAFPYAALSLMRVGDWLKRGRGGWQRALPILIAAIAAVQVVMAWRQAEAARLPEDVRAATGYLREHATREDRVLPDQRFHPYVELESGLPLEAFVSLEWTPDRKALNQEAFQRLLKDAPPTLIVLDYFLADDPDNMVNSNLDIFKIPKRALEADDHGLHFRRVFFDGDFVIYRVTRAGAAP